MSKINGPAVPDFTTPLPKATPSTLPKGAGDFTKPAPNPFTPKQDVRPATPADRGNNPNRVAGVIGKVGDYLGNVARSARDIPTAVGTALSNTAASVPAPKGGSVSDKAKNLVSQVAQTVGAVGGKKDNSRSDQYSWRGNSAYGNTSTSRRATGKPAPSFAINEAAPRPTGKAKPKNGGKENSQVK